MRAVPQLARLNYLDEGKINGVAYDTAWVARVKDEWGKPLFRECIKWLLENQRPDGSWGSQIVNYHDRIISTLSALLALKEINGKRFESKIQRGETYIWENIENLERDTLRFVGSELLFPSLMQQAESMGLDLPYHIRTYYREYRMKLEKISESLWYSPFITLSHSLEFLGDRVDVNRLPDILLPNGCVGNSPAATAFYLRYRKDERALMFLKRILQSTGDGSVMPVYPINVFEHLWTTYNLMIAGVYFEEYTRICDFLRNYMGPYGVGMSTEYPVPDADDTSVLCKFLYRMRYPVDFGVLEAYDTGDYFTTYTYELDPSVTTNIHVLDCVGSCPKFPDRDRVIGRLIHFLKKEMHPDGFWRDKWHVSPYYATSHAVLALCDTDPSLAESVVSWILSSQKENGMWGENGGTLEETAYAVQALMYYHQHVERIDMERISGAMSALNLGVSNPLFNDLPDLWIGKVLYSPSRIVWSSIASAQIMARIGRFEMSASRTH